MNFIKKMFAKKDWRLCKKLDSTYEVQNTQTKKIIKEKCTLTYYLFENQFGDRKFDVVDSEEGNICTDTIRKDHYAFRNIEYRETIHPWLKGFNNPKIPSYEGSKRKEFKDSLTGKVT